MTITAATADQLEALATTIFDPATGIGLHGQDNATDAQYFALVAPVALAIDGRTVPAGFRHTLNVTNALQGRPMHWFMEMNEYNIRNPNVSSKYPAQCGLLLVEDAPTGWSYSANSYGYSIGLATCAAICRAWATIIRLWLAGNYPLAVSNP